MPTQDRYTIIGEIASGTTATVYLAEDKVLRRKVALKKLHPHLWNHSEAVRRFEKEAVAVASLSHGNIIQVYDFGTHERGLFLAMEYVDGGSLEALLKGAPAGLPNLAALSLFQQLLAGLAAAHKAGIYHRDIKPSNILVDSKGCVRIADFGIAFLSQETSLTKTGSYLGTPGYSAPEQAQGLPATDKTDVFASGILFYRSLTGKLPFEAETPHAVLIAIMEKTPVRANLVNRRLLPGLAELVEEMLAKGPAQRPDAKHCLNKLELLAGRLGIVPDAASVRGFIADPPGHTQAEYRHLSEAFARQARGAMVAGHKREAMKHFSLAEIFAETDSGIGREAAEFLQRQVRSSLLRKRACLIASILLSVLLGIGIRHFLAASLSALGAPSKPMAERKPSGASGGQAYAAGIAKAVTIQPALVIRQTAAVASKPAPVPSAKPKSAIHGPLKIAVKRAPAKGESAHAVLPSSAVVFAPASGFLRVKSNPPFAKVRIDGKSVGSTPFTSPLELALGSHWMDLERDSCAPMRSEFTIAPGETTSLRFTLDRARKADP